MTDRACCSACAERVTKRERLFDSGDSATVERGPDRLIQRPEGGRVEIHGADSAVDVAALQALMRRKTMFNRISSIASTKAARNCGSNWETRIRSAGEA